MAYSTDKKSTFLRIACAISYTPYALFFGRETNDASRTTYEEGGLFQHPALGSFASLEIPQPYLDCFPRNFCPADLRIFGEDCGCFGILNFQVQNLNDTVINLNVCHGLLLVGGQ